MASRDSIRMNMAIEQARGWVASVVLHLAVGAGALFFTVEINKPVLRDSFRWDISMVKSPTRAESQPAEPVVELPSPQITPKPPVRQPRPSIVEQPSPQIRPESMASAVTTQAVTDLATHAEPVMTYAAVASAESEPVASATIVEASAESIAPQPEHRLVQYRQVRYRETRADYGWLRDALWGRIEELKRYPTVARTNHWEGKVVVSAVIRDDGEVMGVQIAETSGRAVLDEEAMAVMRRASPLRLKHPLGQRQITILIPINYRLDG